MALYLVKRGERPDYHKAPYHPVIICDKKRIALWESMGSDKHCWVWMQPSGHGNGAGWLLVKWNGLDVDYGVTVHRIVLPDGSEGGFWRDYPSPDGYIGDLLPGAVWWSDKRLPEWLQQKGVVYPSDSHTQQVILDHINDDGCYGCGREIPDWWKPVTA